MTYNQLITNVLNKIGHPGGSELVSKSDVVLYVNVALSYIEAANDWYFLKITRTITPDTPATAFTLPAECYRAFTVTGITGTTRTILAESAVYGAERSYHFTRLTIITTEEYDSVEIHGNWATPVLTNETTPLNQEIDLPHLLVSALYLLVLGHCVTIYIDNGFQIAQDYRGQADNYIKLALTKYAHAEVQRLVPNIRH